MTDERNPEEGLHIMQTIGGISFSDSFQQMFDRAAEFLPKLIGALIILIVGWFIARIIRKVVRRFLAKVNFDGLVDRSGLGGPIERAGYPDSGLLIAKIVYFMIMLVVLQLSVDALGIEAIKDLLDSFVAWIPKLIVALIIVLITGAVANFVKDIVGGATATQSWGNFATTAAVVGVWFIGGFAALDQVQVASDVVDTLFQTIMASLGAIIVIKYGIGGIWAARDRFWPSVYDRVGASTRDTSS